MADEVKETKEITDTEAEAKIDAEIEQRLVDKVDEIINPKEVVEEKKEEKKEEVTEEKKEEVKEDKQTEVTEEVKEEAKEGESESTAEGEEEETPTKKVADLKLPNRLLQAAKRNHISDEEVLEYGEHAESILSRLADASDRVSERLGDLGRKLREELRVVKKEEVKPTTLKLPEDFDAEAGKQIMDVFNTLNAEIAELKKSSTEKDKQSTLMAESELDKKIDTFFDGQSEGYPEFGKSANLSNAQLVMRQDVWSTADNIMIGSKANATPITVGEALEMALSIYEGKHPTKVRDKIVKEVVEREKQQTHRPTSKKAKTAVEKGDDAAVKAVTEILNRGKDGWL